MDMELRKRYEHLTDGEIAAASLMEVVGWLLKVADTYPPDQYPRWLEECQGLIRCAVEHLGVEMAWEEFVLMAAVLRADLRE